MNYTQALKQDSRFLLFGFIMALSSSMGQTYFISLFSEPLRHHFSLSHGDFGLIYSVATLLSGLSLIWIGAQIDKLPLKFFTVCVCASGAIASLSMMFINEILWLVIAFFSLRILGQGLCAHISATSMARYCGHFRGRALSIAGLGYPLGEAVLPLCVVFLIQALGWRETWGVISLVIAAVLIPTVWILLKNHSHRHKQFLFTYAEEKIEQKGNNSWRRKDVLRDWHFYAMLPAVCMPAFILTGIFFHQSALIEQKGWSMAYWAATFMVFAAGHVVGTLLIGPRIDNLGAKHQVSLYCIPLMLGLIILGFSNHPVFGGIFMALAGMTVGINRTLHSALWAECYGVKHLGEIKAFTTALVVFSTSLAPLLFGRLIDLGISMSHICLALAILTYFCMAVYEFTIRTEYKTLQSLGTS